MYWLSQTSFRYQAVVLFMIGVLAHVSGVRAQTITTVDALWAWDGQNLSVCQDPTSETSIANCLGGLTNDTSNPENGGALTPNPTTDGDYVYAYNRTASGWAYKCPVDAYGANCVQITVGPFDTHSVLVSIVASNGYLWIAQFNAGNAVSAVYRCPSDMPWNEGNNGSLPEECGLIFQKYLTQVSSISVVNGFIYVATLGQGIWRCDITAQNACSLFNDPGSATVPSITVAAGYLWAALNNGILWRCDLYNANSCVDWNTAGSILQDISYDNQGNIGVAVSKKFGTKQPLWSCPTAYANACKTLLSTRDGWFRVAAGDGRIFGSADETAGKSSRVFFRSAPYTNSNYTQDDPTPIGILYVPAGGITSPSSVNLSVPLATGRSSPAVATHSTTRAALAKLAKRCERGGRVQARLSLKGPHGSVKRNVNLCKYIKDGRPQVNFAALDRGHFYKITARVEEFYGEASFYLDGDGEIKNVSVELKRRGK